MVDLGMKTTKALLILTAALSAASVYADRVLLPSAPKVVQDAVKSRAGRTRIDELDRNVSPTGEVTYQAIWKANGVPQELVVTEAGTIVRDVIAPTTSLSADNLTLANKVGVALTDAPLAVQNAIHNQLLGGAVDNVQKGIWNGQTIYEVTYHNNGRLATYQVSETGQPIVGQVPANAWSPRYSGLAQSNVKLAPGVKMDFTTAPRAVQNTVNHLSNGARIDDFQRGVWLDRNVYEATFKRNGELTQVQVLDDGTLLTRAPGSEAPTLPTAVGAPPPGEAITVQP
jgi:hypothetical protein